MNRTTTQEIIHNQLSAYLKGNKKQKAVILDQLVVITGYQRKALIRRLRQLQLHPSPPRKTTRAGPKTTYGADVTAALKQLWDLSHELSGERLHPSISTLVSALQRRNHWQHGTDTTHALLRMSLATTKRRIAGFRKQQAIPALRGLSAAKPSELKELIPIRRGPWDNHCPDTARSTPSCTAVAACREISSTPCGILT